MDENTLMFYAQKLEIDLEKEGTLMFHEGNLPIEAIKEYDNGVGTNAYYWLDKHIFSPKGKMILAFIAIGIIASFAIVALILNQAFGYDIIQDWLFAEL